MKKPLSKIILGIEVLAALLILGAIYVWAPVCDSLLTLENGNMVHMKCFYTAQASVALALLLFISAIIAFLSKADHRKIQFVIIAIGALLIINTYSSVLGIGICKMDTMACHATAFWLRLGGIIAILSALIDICANRDKSGSLTL